MQIFSPFLIATISPELYLCRNSSEGERLKQASYHPLTFFISGFWIVVKPLFQSVFIWFFGV